MSALLMAAPCPGIQQPVPRSPGARLLTLCPDLFQGGQEIQLCLLLQGLGSVDLFSYGSLKQKTSGGALQFSLSAGPMAAGPVEQRLQTLSPAWQGNHRTWCRRSPKKPSPWLQAEAGTRSVPTAARVAHTLCPSTGRGFAKPKRV